MELSDLRIFKAVVEEGGVVRAARKLHRVQSSITTRIKQLEASLGAELFHRDRQRLFLSPAGEHLLAYADRLLNLAEEARQAVSRTPPRGVLRLGSLEATSASRLPQVLAAFHRAYPEVQVRLTTGTNDALTAAVAQRRLDAAFVAERPSSREFEHQALFEEELVLISPADHRPIRTPADVEGDSVVAFPNGCAYRRVLLRWLGDRRLPTVRVMEVGSYHAIVACVASGAGVAVMPESVLATMPDLPVRRHALPRVHARIVTPLIWRTGERTPALQALQDLLRPVP